MVAATAQLLKKNSSPGQPNSLDNHNNQTYANRGD